MAAALPILSAVAPMVSAFAGLMGKSSPPSPPSPAPPPPAPTAPTPEPSKEPTGELDAEAAKQRALARKRAQNNKGLSLLDDTTGAAVEQKTLTGQ